MSRHDVVRELMGLYRLYAICFGGLAVAVFWAYTFFLDAKSAVEFWTAMVAFGIGAAVFIISMSRWWRLIQEMKRL